MKLRVEGVTALVAAVIVSFLVTASPGFAEETAHAAAYEAEAEMAAKGKQLYAHHCSHCHGFNMVNPGTIAYDLRQFPHEDKARFVHSVTTGKNGRMPAWGDLLSGEDIDELWAYVKTGGQQ